MQRPQVLAAGLLCLIAILVTNLAFSQISESAKSGPAGGEETVKALLNEVRELRLALQKTSLNGYRAQLIGERIRTQQERVDRMTNQFEEVHSEMTGLQVEIPPQLEQLREVENRLRQEQNPERRVQLEAQVQEVKASVEDQKRRADRLREREAQLSGQLRDEKAKLDGLQDKADAVEHELEQEMENLTSPQKRTTPGKRD